MRSHGPWACRFKRVRDVFDETVQQGQGDGALQLARDAFPA
jgi:hypothetical protein